MDNKQSTQNLRRESDKFNAIQRVVSQAYFKQSANFFILHQIQSYNLLFEKQLKESIEGFNPIVENINYRPIFEDFETQFEIRLCNPTFKQPYITESDGQKVILTPFLSRMRQCNYQTQMQCDIEVIQKSYVIKNQQENKKNMKALEPILAHSLGDKHELKTARLDHIDYQKLDKQQLQQIRDEYEYVVRKKQFKQYNFTKIPIMVGSNACVTKQMNFIDRNECKYDQGGYFIIQGNEKVIISQDRICENKIFVFKNSKSQQQQYYYRAEVRSTSQRFYSSVKLFKIQLSTKSNLYGQYIRCNIQNIKRDIPIFILFRALGVEEDQKIIQLCGERFRSDLSGSIYDANATHVYTKDAALLYLQQYIHISSYHFKEFQANEKIRQQSLTDILKSELLCHIEGDQSNKIIFIRDMIQALILTNKGLRQIDDRDSQCNKKIEPPGTLVVKLFRSHFNKFRKFIKSAIMKEMRQPNRAHNECIINEQNMNNIFKSLQIEQGLRSSLSTGFWGDKNNAARPGVAQVLNRMNYISTCSHLRRINTHLEKNDKTVIGPRYTHNSQCFYICVNETPEGSQVGLVKNLAISAQITHGSEYQVVIDVIDQELKLKHINLDNFDDYFYQCRLEVNGQRIYYVNNEQAQEVYQKLLNFKRTFILDYQTSIIFDYTENVIKINVEAGRITRPLFITSAIKRLINEHDQEGQILLDKILKFNQNPVINYYDNDQHNKQLQHFYQLMYNPHFPVIEFIDTLQAETGILISLDLNSQNFDESQYTEIDSQFMLSIMSSAMPYSNHNQAPRNAYYTSMAKQAIGIHSTQHKQRFDTTSNVLNQLQTPLIKTHCHEYTNMDNMPFGQNLTIAVMCYSGFNQEDSIIMNKGSIDRGMFYHTQYKTYKEKNIGNLATGEPEQFIQKLDNPKRSNNYKKVNKHGLVDVGTYVQQGDVIMCKQLIQKEQNDQIRKDDTSISLKNNERGFIDCNIHDDNYFKTRDQDAYNFTKVRIRLPRQPEVGDKFASVHAQKGLLGKILNTEDMPYAQDGTIPDVIINSNAFPSRMTIGQMIEILNGYVCLHSGQRGYGDTFNSLSVQQIRNMLTTFGLNSKGNKIFYDGISGNQLQCEIFSGSCYMIRLKHLSDNKIHAREVPGPVAVTTRQPSEGRQKAGGLKFGYMENDCQIAHGGLNFLREKLLDTSDLFQIAICNNCHTQQSVNNYCRNCLQSTNFTVTYQNYSTGILRKELEQMHIRMNYLTV